MHILLITNFISVTKVELRIKSLKILHNLLMSTFCVSTDIDYAFTLLCYMMNTSTVANITEPLSTTMKTSPEYNDGRIYVFGICSGFLWAFWTWTIITSIIERIWEKCRRSF